MPKEPVGLFGDGAIVFGGGAVFDKQNKVSLKLSRSISAAHYVITMRARACLPSFQTDKQDALPHLPSRPSHTPTSSVTEFDGHL